MGTANAKAEGSVSVARAPCAVRGAVSRVASCRAAARVRLAAPPRVRYVTGHVACRRLGALGCPLRLVEVDKTNERTMTNDRFIT